MRRSAIAACVIAAPFLWTEDASAADVFDSAQLVIAPIGALPAESDAVIKVLALAADGTPRTGLKLKPRATEGRVQGWQETGEGWYSFRFHAPPTTAPVDVTLEVTGDDVQASLDVPVVPTAGSAIAVRVNPPSMVLGSTTGATVSFQLDTNLPSAELEFAVSSGELTDLTEMGGGAYTARYSPPSVNYPHLAIITVTAKDHPNTHGVGVIKLQGAVEFPVTGPADASVVLEIGEGEYGPVKLSSKGAGRVPIIVSPGIGDATEVLIQQGQRTEKEIDLQIPPTRRLAWVPVGGVLPEDGAFHSVYVVVREATGEPAVAAELSVSAEGAEVEQPRHLDAGLYELRIKGAAGHAKITASLGDKDVDKAELGVSFLSAMPTTPGTLPPTSTGAVAGVVGVPRTRTVAPKQTATIVVAAVDRHGYPVPNTRILLSSSTGSIQSSVVTSNKGTAEVEYKASQTGFSRIDLQVGDWKSSTGVLVSAEPVDVIWPSSSGPQATWESLIGASPGVTSHPEASSAPPKPVEEPPKPAEAPALKAAQPNATVDAIKVLMAAELAPGAEVVVHAQALADELGVAGQELEFLSNIGSFGAVRDNGDGDYEATLVLPKEGNGEVRVTVISPSGVLGRGISLLSQAEPIPQDPKTLAPHKIPKVRVRAGFSFGSYQYAQRPSSTPGPLIPGALVVGGPDGGTPAPLLGFEADARAWFIPYLGMRLGFRTSHYTISADVFNSDAPDWLVHLRADITGRYPFKLGNDQFWIGAAGGFQMDDFLLFKGCLEPGCAVAYDQLLVPGLELGGELGAEVGPVFFVATVMQGLAKPTVPYRLSVDGDVGLEVTSFFFVDLGASVVSRKLRLEGRDSGNSFGEITDTELSGKISVGIQL